MYEGSAQALEGVFQAQSEYVKSLYFTFLQRQLPPPIKDFPIFRENFWNVIQLDLSTRRYFNELGLEVSDLSEAFYTDYIVDEPYYSIPYLYNVIYDPTIILKQGTELELNSPVESGQLLLFVEYQNQYNLPIVHNNVSIKPGEAFIAENPNYTVPGGATGAVYQNRDYMIICQEDPTVVIDPNSSKKNMVSSVRFRKNRDPFEKGLGNLRVLANGNKQISFFAPKVFIDNQDLHDMFGVIVGIFAETSYSYKNFIEGLLYLYTMGPTVAAMNVGLNVAYGYPYARDDENIRQVYVFSDHYQLVSDKNNEYIVPRKVVKVPVIVNGFLQYETKVFPGLKLSNAYLYDPVINNYRLNGDFEDPTVTPVSAFPYDVIWPVKRFDTFIENLKVVDHKAEPFWWRKFNSAKQFFGIKSLSNESRNNPEIVDDLFLRFFKEHTFGVFIDGQNLAYFSGVKNVLSIINEVKPTSSAYLLEMPNLDFASELDTSDTQTGIYDMFELVQFYPLRSRYFIPIQLGMRLQGLYNTDINKRVPLKFGMKPMHQFANTYDLFSMDIAFNNLYSTYTVISREVLNSGKVLGKMPNEGVIEQCHVEIGFDPESSLDTELEIEDEVTIEVGP